nr:hypothetical protein [Bacillota bacterium]
TKPASIQYSNRAGDLSQVDLYPRGDPRFFAEAKKKPERISAPVSLLECLLPAPVAVSGTSSASRPGNL